MYGGLIKMSELKEVLIQVNRGCISIGKLPKGITLVIQDYGVDGSEERLKKDDSGKQYQERVYMGEIK